MNLSLNLSLPDKRLPLAMRLVNGDTRIVFRENNASVDTDLIGFAIMPVQTIRLK